MTLAELRQLAAATGFPDPSLAAAVAMAESGGNPCARGDPAQGPDCTSAGSATSFGLWQIHVTSHPEYSPAELFDPAQNAAAAYAISQGGRNWRPWTAYTSGRYAQFLPGGAVAAPAMLVALSFAIGAVWVRGLRAPIF